ncbi:MAG: diguanylate cyclase [Gammaproteobacteria bacterium]|nr:diguanylate cyclase [Gammaproteobacteria bacterium]
MTEHDSQLIRNKILVVDDNEDIIKVMRFLISAKTEVDAIYASSFSEAMALAEQHRDSIFLTILDLNLPDSPDGEVVQHILSLGLPAIVFTGNFDPEMRKQFLGMGVVDYVLKDNRMVYEYIIRIINRIWRNRDIKVLVVDDSFTMRNQLARFLLLQQLQIHTAEDGVEALAVLHEHPDIKLVITDHNMPNMDGFQLVTEIRRNHAREDMGIIGLSGEGTGELSARFLKIGANDFLAKPFYHEEFFSRIMQNLETMEQLEEIREASRRDYLTNLYNRRYFYQRASELFKNAEKSSVQLSVAILDIDHFKQVNDEYGHDVGDRVIKDLAGLLNREFSDQLVARFGGEEFCILFSDVKTDDVMHRLDTFRQQLQEQSLDIETESIRYTVSTGVDVSSSKGIDKMITSADEALYRAKAGGRNRVELNS